MLSMSRANVFITPGHLSVAVDNVQPDVFDAIPAIEHSAGDDHSSKTLVIKTSLISIHLTFFCQKKPAVPTVDDGLPADANVLAQFESEVEVYANPI